MSEPFLDRTRANIARAHRLLYHLLEFTRSRRAPLLHIDMALRSGCTTVWPRVDFLSNRCRRAGLASNLTANSFCATRAFQVCRTVPSAVMVQQLQPGRTRVDEIVCSVRTSADISMLVIRADGVCPGSTPGEGRSYAREGPGGQ